MDVSQLTVATGAGVSAFGRVVSAAGAVWFEPPLPVHLIYYLPGQQPAPRPSGLGVTVRGVDLAALLDPREKDGALEGWATITGVWQDDELVVSAQSTVQPPSRFRLPSWTVPPCPPPAGGWPSGDTPDGLGAELAALTASGVAVQVTMFSPPGRGQVLVVSASDPELAESRLRPVCGKRLCVIPSRYTQAQVDAVRADIASHFQDWQVDSSGLTSGEDGQIAVTLRLVRLTPAIAGWAEQVPDGLLGRRPLAGSPSRQVTAEPGAWTRIAVAALAAAALTACTGSRPATQSHRPEPPGVVPNGPAHRYPAGRLRR